MYESKPSYFPTQKHWVAMLSSYEGEDFLRRLVQYLQVNGGDTWQAVSMEAFREFVGSNPPFPSNKDPYFAKCVGRSGDHIYVTSFGKRHIERYFEVPYWRERLSQKNRMPIEDEAVRLTVALNAFHAEYLAHAMAHGKDIEYNSLLSWMESKRPLGSKYTGEVPVESIAYHLGWDVHRILTRISPPPPFVTAQAARVWDRIKLEAASC